MEINRDKFWSSNVSISFNEKEKNYETDYNKKIQKYKNILKNHKDAKERYNKRKEAERKSSGSSESTKRDRLSDAKKRYDQKIVDSFIKDNFGDLTQEQIIKAAKEKYPEYFI